MEKKTKRILHRPITLESDSSSSLAESCESLTGGREGSGSREKEKEHYDKLKLNLDNLSGNKRALSGKSKKSSATCGRYFLLEEIHEIITSSNLYQQLAF